MEDIPIAQPITSPLLTNTTTSIEICKSCQNFFVRSERDRHTSSYFRCEKCQRQQLQTAIVTSCVVS